MEREKQKREKRLPGNSDWIEKNKSGWGLCPAVLKQTGDLIGHAGLVRQEVDGRAEWEVGYWLAKKYWGEGFATEAAIAFRDYAFDQLGVERLICIIQPANLGSIHVAKKIGMTKEKETLFHSVPVVIYSMT